MSFDEITYWREADIEGQKKWKWITGESGAWDGPLNDWNTSHKALYQKHCKQFRTVIQAGGNQGLYPYLFSKMFERVYTFEPDALNFHCLVANCQSPNIFKYNAALGMTSGLVSLNKAHMNNTGMHSINHADKGFIPILALDSFAFDGVDLIQLDVEDYEIYALKGARQTIKEHKPVITVERCNSTIVEELAQYGYKAVDTSYADTFFVVSD